MKYLFSIIAFLLLQSQAWATDIHMTRSESSFPETMLKLQSVIDSMGYKVSRVQRVDIGLTKMGYQTDKYRVVFYGKPEQHNMLVKSHPELIPYLPLKIAIFAEREETLLIAANPTLLLDFASPELKPIFQKWEDDLAIIMAKMRGAVD